LLKHHYSKPLLIALMEKILFDKKVAFYWGITRLLVDRFVSVLCVSVLSKEELMNFSFKEVMLSYLAL
jgi:hypothetical protein